MFCSFSGQFNYLSDLSKGFHSWEFNKQEVSNKAWYKVEELLNEYSQLSENEVQSVIEYAKEELPKKVQLAIQEQKALHLRPRETGMLLPMQITKEGNVFFLLKKWGEELGTGIARKVRRAIFLSDLSVSLVAHSTEKLTTHVRKVYSNKEICILNKLSHFLRLHPNVKGLLKFYNFIDYQTKDVFVSSSSHEGYSDLEGESENPSSSLSNDKRGVITKLYNAGNLKEVLSSLSFSNKKEVGLYILEGLACLHALNIFHSDLKEDNIFLEIDPLTKEVKEAVIGDFGFSCDLTLKEDCFFKNGFKEYRAPEMLKAGLTGGMPIDESMLACDIYAMGIILEKLFYNDATLALQELIHTMKADDPLERPNALAAFFEFQNVMENIVI